MRGCHVACLNPMAAFPLTRRTREAVVLDMYAAWKMNRGRSRGDRRGDGQIEWGGKVEEGGWVADDTQSHAALDASKSWT